MRTCVLVGLVALLTGFSLSSELSSAGRRQTERQGLASVEVTVVAQDGSRAPGLARKDFEVLVDGQARPIESATADDRPVLVALLLDLSSSSPAQPPILKPALEKRFWNSLGTDRVRLGLVGVSPWGLSPSYGVERRALQSALHLLDLPPTYAVQDKLVPTTSSATPQIGVRERRATGVRMGPSPIWDAVYDATSALEKEPGRRTIILLADGRATGNVHGLDETITHALAARISIHVVSAAEDDLVAVDASNAALIRPSLYLKTLAEVTGGSFASLAEAVSTPHQKETSAEKVSEQVGALLTRALRLAHAQYRLGFSVQTLDTSLHRLEVRVTRPGLTACSPTRLIAAKPSR